MISGANVVTNVDAHMSIPRPGDAPAAVSTVDLTPSEEGEISSEAAAAQGETIEVQVDPGLAGEWVSVWGHSTPVLLGDWVQVSSTGKVTVPISSTMPTGAHQLVAQDADGEVIGWTPIQIAAGAAGLASTGSPITSLVAPFAATLLLMAAVWLAGSTLSVALEAIGKVLIWIGSGIVWLVLLPVGFVAERIHDWREDRYFRKARAREKARQEESEDDLI